MKKFKRSSGILVQNKNKILLCKRAPKENFKKKWSIPMGGIEGSETPIEAAYREFYEETNLKIEEPIDLIGFLNKVSKDQQTKTGIVYVYFYETDDDNFLPDLKNAKDGHEHTECKYFSKDQNPLDQNNKDLISIIKKLK